MSENTKFWKLDSPSMCRDFLKSVRHTDWPDGISYLQTASGKRLSIDEASDEQVMEVAGWFAEAMRRKKS